MESLARAYPISLYSHGKMHVSSSSQIPISGFLGYSNMVLALALALGVKFLRWKTC
jgi:hypothetical protein